MSITHIQFAPGPSNFGGGMHLEGLGSMIQKGQGANPHSATSERHWATVPIGEAFSAVLVAGFFLTSLSTETPCLSDAVLELERPERTILLECWLSLDSASSQLGLQVFSCHFARCFSCTWAFPCTCDWRWSSAQSLLATGHSGASGAAGILCLSLLHGPCRSEEYSDPGFCHDGIVSWQKLLSKKRHGDDNYRYIPDTQNQCLWNIKPGLGIWKSSDGFDSFFLWQFPIGTSGCTKILLGVAFGSHILQILSTIRMIPSAVDYPQALCDLSRVPGEDVGFTSNIALCLWINATWFAKLSLYISENMHKVMCFFFGWRSPTNEAVFRCGEKQHIENQSRNSRQTQVFLQQFWAQ